MKNINPKTRRFFLHLVEVGKLAKRVLELYPLTDDEVKEMAMIMATNNVSAEVAEPIDKEMRRRKLYFDPLRK